MSYSKRLVSAPFSYHIQIIMKGGKRNHTQKNQH